MTTSKFRIAFLLSLMFVSFPVSSAELFCKGRGWIEGGDGFKSTALLKFNPNTLDASLNVWQGVARGTLAAGEKLYTGMLTFPSGQQAWINLDRYTGELLVSPPTTADGKPLIFLGACEGARPKF